MTFKSLIPILLSLPVSLLIGCTHETAPPRQSHEGQKLVEPQPTHALTEREQKAALVAPVKTVNVATLNTDASVYQESVAPYEKYILDESYLQNAEFTHSQKGIDMLQQFNLGVLRLIDLKSPLAEPLLDRYEKAVLAGCSPQLDGCLHLDYFRLDPRSSRIVAVIAQRQKASMQFYQRLFIAFDISNREEDPSLTRLYLSRVSELFSSLKDDTSGLLPRHQRILGLVFKVTKDQQNMDWLKQINPFQLSTGAANPLGSVGTDLFNYAIRFRLYENNRLSPEFRQALDGLNARPLSFAQKQEKLFTEQAKVVLALKLNKVATDNEYFFLIDRLYNDQLGPSEARAIWQNSKKDAAFLVSTVQDYMRLQMIFTLQSSNQRWIELFKDRRINDIMINEAILRGADVGLQWKTFFGFAQAIRRFSDQALRLDSSQSALADQLDQYFGSFRQNVKLLAVYPHMMMISYEIAKNGFAHNFEIPNQGMPVESARIMDLLFSGSFRPWFDYGTDDNPQTAPKLSRFEILDAFQFALETGTFENFNIDAADFFSVLGDKLLGEKSLALEQEVTNLKQKYDLSNQWHTLLDICDRIKDGAVYNNHMNLIDLRSGPLFGPFLDSLSDAFEGTTIDADATGRAMTRQGLFPYSTRSVNALETVFLSDRPIERYFDLLASIYKKYLEQTGSSQTEIQEKLAPLDRHLGHFKDLQTAFVSKFYQRRNEFSRCFPLWLQRERDLQAQLINRETEYFKRVHADLQQLADHPELAAQLNADHTGHGLPAEAKQWTRFQNGTYNLYQLDALARMKQDLEETSEAGPPLAPGTHIDIPSNLNKSDEFFSPMVAPIPYSKDETQFVNTALRALFNQSGPGFLGMLKWTISTTPDITHYNGMIMGDAILYRMGPVTNQNGQIQELKPSDFIQSTLNAVNYYSYTPAESKRLSEIGLKSRIIKDIASVPETLVSCGWELKPIFNYALDAIGNSRMADDYYFMRIYSCLAPEPRAIQPDIFPIRTEAQEFYVYQSNHESFIFNPLIDFSQSLRPVFGQLLKGDEDRWYNAYKAILDRYASDSKSQSVTTIILDPGIVPQPGYLTDGILATHRGGLMEFNRQTFNYFDVNLPAQ